MKSLNLPNLGLKLSGIFIFLSLILLSLSLVSNTFVSADHPIDRSSSSSSSSSYETCQNDNGCPISGSNSPAFSFEDKKHPMINDIIFNIVKLIVGILAGLTILAFVPLTITGIVLLANKKSKFWSIFCLAFSPVVFVLLIIIFTVVNVFQQVTIG
jgi:hypothetical protein